MNNLRSSEEFQENIRHKTSNVLIEEPKCMSRNMFSWCEACLEAVGHEIESSIK
jgi:hypothetical protein